MLLIMLEYYPVASVSPVLLLTYLFKFLDYKGERPMLVLIQDLGTPGLSGLVVGSLSLACDLPVLLLKY